MWDFLRTILNAFFWFSFLSVLTVSHHSWSHPHRNHQIGRHAQPCHVKVAICSLVTQQLLVAAPLHVPTLVSLNKPSSQIFPLWTLALDLKVDLKVSCKLKSFKITRTKRYFNLLLLLLLWIENAHYSKSLSESNMKALLKMSKEHYMLFVF